MAPTYIVRGKLFTPARLTSQLLWGFTVVSIQHSFVSVPLEPGRSFDLPSVGLCCNDFPKHASWGFRALPAMELPVRLELTTARLQVGCATIAPRKHIQFVLKHRYSFTLSALGSRLAAYYLPKLQNAEL